MRFRDRCVSVIGAVAVCAGLMVFPMLVAVDQGSAHGGVQHPVTINTGTCAALGDVVIPLGDAGDQLPIDGQPSAGGSTGAAGAVPVDGSITRVQMTMADLLAGPYALVVHASADEMETVAACGNIGGRMIGMVEFPVGIAQVDEAGTNGVGILRDNGDGTTQVAIYVIKHDVGAHSDHAADEHTGHGEATPVP